MRFHATKQLILNKAQSQAMGCLMRPAQAKFRTHQSGHTDLPSLSFHYISQPYIGIFSIIQKKK